MNKIATLIMGMTAVTYLPRLIPFYLFNPKNINNKVKLFLKTIPFAALGALIFPGVLNAIPGEKIISLIGLGTAIIISWYSKNIILPVMGSIIIVLTILLII